jgi:hypothetical protein
LAAGSRILVLAAGSRTLEIMDRSNYHNRIFTLSGLLVVKALLGLLVVESLLGLVVVESLVHLLLIIVKTLLGLVVIESLVVVETLLGLLLVIESLISYYLILFSRCNLKYSRDSIEWTLLDDRFRKIVHCNETFFNFQEILLYKVFFEIPF